VYRILRILNFMCILGVIVTIAALFFSPTIAIACGVLTVLGVTEATNTDQRIRQLKGRR
jgi:uncharacterized membrane protein